jgi:hypothetical protein
MKKDINRAEQLWQNWEERQQRMEKLLGTSAENTRAIQQEKYDFMRKGLYRLSVQPNEKEKVYLNAIALVTSSLQKKLYPNRFVRLMHQIKASLYDKPMHLRRFQQQKEASLELLKHQFKALGLSSYSGKLENYLDYESNRIGIPMTTQLADKGTLDIVVHLEKDKTGEYHFKEYKATILRDGQPERSHIFDGDTTISAQEAVNLLNGRPVLKSYETADGLIAQKWIQLDITANPANDQYRTKEYHHADGMERSLNDVFPKIGITGANKKDLLNELQQGNQIAYQARPPISEMLYLEANPAEQSILIRDQNRQPVNVETLMERKEDAQKMRVENTLTLVKQKENDKEQSQSLGIG